MREPWAIFSRTESSFRGPRLIGFFGSPIGCFTGERQYILESTLLLFQQAFDFTESG
jgi:hypothetical protein